MRAVAWIAVLFSLSSPAFATTDADYACALPEPAPNPVKPPETGINLGDIVKDELGTSGSWTAAVEPTIGIDVDWGHRLVNLTPGPAGRDLVFQDSRNGYEALDYYKLGGGLGAQLMFNYGNSTLLAPALWATVGLLPTAGGAVESERFFGDRGSLDARPHAPSLGDSLAALDSLRPRDALTYDTYGAIVFWAGIGYGMVGNVTASGLARGDFEVHLEKIDADHVYVKITDADLKELGLQAGNFLTNVSVTGFSRYAGSLGFSINFHDRVGAAAYHDLVLGNVAPVQKLAASGRTDAVKFLDDQNGARRGITTRFWAGIPVIMGIDWTKTRYFEALRHRFYGCGRDLRATYGSFFQRFEAKAFGVGQNFTKAFYGTSYALESGAGKAPLARGFFGELVWSYRGTHTMPQTFRSAMAHLASNTGAGEALVLHVPESVKNRMNFTSLTFRARFDAAHVQRLLKNAGERGQLNSVAVGLAQTYFASVHESGALCELLAPESDAAADTGACAGKVISLTSRGVDRMVATLGEMGEALRKGDEKGATNAFARFGEAMLTNPFTMQAGFELAGAGVPVDYVAEGSDFFRYVSLSRTDEKGGLVPDRRDPLFEPRNGRGLHGIDAFTLKAL